MASIDFENTKVCFKCHKRKKKSKFGKDKRTKDGLQAICRECCNRRQAERYAVFTVSHDTEHRRKLKAKRRYGITSEEFDRLLRLQHNFYAICGAEESDLSRRLAVDHNHSTNQVRGLLCSNCNRGLGHFRDSSILLKKAIAYLANPPASAIGIVYYGDN